MTFVAPPKSYDPGFELLSPKAKAAWTALTVRYAAQLTADEIAYLYAHYLLGLTSVFYDNEASATHLAAYRTLLEIALAPDEAERALHVRPKISAAWVEAGFASIERLGRKDAEALLAPAAEAPREGELIPPVRFGRAIHTTTLDQTAHGSGTLLGRKEQHGRRHEAL